MSVQKKFNDAGAVAEWVVREHCTWSRTFRATHGTQPVDVSSFTVTAAVSLSEDSDETLKSFTCEIISGVDGKFRIYVDADDADLAPGRYWWAMQWDDSTRPVPLASGPFIVKHWTL